MNDWKIEITGFPDIRRIMRDEHIVGFANRQGNGRWAALDSEGTRLTNETFDSPRRVLIWIQNADSKKTREM